MALLHLNKEAAWRSLGRWGWSSTEYPVEVWSPSWEQVTLRNLHPNWDKNLKKTNVWGQAVGNLADHAFQSSWIQSFKSWRGKKRKDVCLWLKTLMSLFSWLLMLEKVQRGWLCSWNPCLSFASQTLPLSQESTVSFFSLYCPPHPPRWNPFINK